jgi:phosphohistidine phosphatase
MKTFYLMRHAKTEGERADLKDYDRRLLPRGIEDARSAALWFKKKEWALPDLILCSTAVRAVETVAFMMASAAPLSAMVDYKKTLYHAPAEALLDEMTGCDDAIQSLMLVAHNPGIGALARSLASHLSAFDLDNYPTSTISVFHLQAESWAALHPAKIKLVDLYTP